MKRRAFLQAASALLASLVLPSVPKLPRPVSVDELMDLWAKNYRPVVRPLNNPYWGLGGLEPPFRAYYYRRVPA